MRQEKLFRAVVLVMVGVFAAAVLSACGGSRSENVKSDGPAAASASAPAAGEEKPAPLAKRYPKIVFQPVSANSQILADYPTATTEFESAAMAALISSGRYETVWKERPGEAHRDALLVKSEIVTMRIVSGAARFWAGSMAGSSDMTVKLTLSDSGTGAIVREKVFSSANSAWGAAWTGGSTDRSLPSDMGRIAAEYLAAVNPAK